MGLKTWAKGYAFLLAGRHEGSCNDWEKDLGRVNVLSNSIGDARAAKESAVFVPPVLGKPHIFFLWSRNIGVERWKTARYPVKVNVFFSHLYELLKIRLVGRELFPKSDIGPI